MHGLLLTMPSIRSIFIFFIVLLPTLLLSIFYLNDPMLGIGVDCSRRELLRRPLVINKAESLDVDEFIKQYISLGDKVKSLSQGEKLLSSFFYYLRSNSKVKVRNKTLVAVITTGRYLLTRALAIYNTWASDVRMYSKLYFFVGEDCNITHPHLKELAIIRVDGTRDNVYPPQRKVFAVLEYIYYHFGDDFKWFIRADDDVYIRMDRLESLLDRMEWSELIYMGHLGRGKAEDKERLKLLKHEDYCMGGPSIVFSTTALRALVPHLRRCLMAIEAYNFKIGYDKGWYNEDVELGRCISRTTGIGCSNHEVVCYACFNISIRQLSINCRWQNTGCF